MLPITRTALIATIFLMLPPALAAQESNRDRIKVEASKVLPNPELHIRRVTLRPGTENVTIAFEARTNVNAIVEVSGSGMAKKSARASGDPPRGKYQVTITGLKSATRYDYAIVVPSGDPRTPYRLTGNFATERPAAVVAQRAPLTESVGYHIRNVRVEATATKASLSFQGRPDVVPIVEISRGAPRPNLDGRLEFRREDLVGGFPMGGTPRTGHYRLELGGRVDLEQGARYHYLINVPSGNVRRPHQEAGTFRMLMQTVRVHFTSIEILNDGNGGNGSDITVHFVAGPREHWVNGHKELRLRSGAVHRIDEVMEFDNAPDTVRVQANAVVTAGQNIFVSNAATALDLTRRPGLNPRTIWLLLESGPVTRTNRFAFRVGGNVDIIRQ
jgi:hypothetical protein